MVIEQLVSEGVLIKGKPTAFENSVRLIKLQNSRVRNSDLYAINIASPKIQELMEK